MSPAGEDERLEGLPFLEVNGANRRATGKNESKLGDSARRDGNLAPPSCVGLILVLVVTTVFGLCGLVLSFQQTVAVGSSHDNGNDSSINEQGAKPTDVTYQEEVPESPKLRDMSEYTLDPDWHVNSEPTTREYYWTIGDAALNPDGIYRPMMLINNQFPGPLVRCNEGDRLIVHVENRAINATAIHFHGMFQNGTNAMDGTVGITQCAIAPNSNFTYDFQVRGQSGTYWYHAHHSAQASDGLLGPMVVHSNDELSLEELDYTSDRVLMVQDHYHNTTSELLMDYLQPDMENDEPVPDNALINGRGARDCHDFPGWRCDSSNRSTPVIDLEKGQRHRLRIINVGAFAEFQIQFDEHAFYVTEVDGTEVQPDEPFHRLNILPAQRYSVVLETNATNTDAFWMRARMVTHCFTTKNDHLEPEIRGIIQYTQPGDPQTTSVAAPTSKDWPETIEVVCRDLNTSALHPMHPIKAPPADAFITLRANFEIGAWALARGFFNESTWHANTTHPSLHRFLEAGHNATSPGAALSTNTEVFDTDNDFVLQTSGARTVDISINNFDDGAHPFHLHGHKFFVLTQGRSGYPPTADELPAYLEENGLAENPLRRDTVTVEGYAWAIIRVVLDNPGLWAFHCHNTWHAESGMVMQFLVREDEVRDWELDPVDKEMCSREGVTRGMRPADSIWYGTL